MSIRENQETWKSDISGTIILRRLDHRGEMTRTEIVPAGKTFHITAEERRLNQEEVASPEFDVFRNGMLRPVRLLDSAEDARELAENPNVMSDTDMRSLLKSHFKTFTSKLGEISNPFALERMLALATSPEVDATISRVEAIKSRLNEVAPNHVPETVAVAPADSDRGAMRAVTPK